VYFFVAIGLGFFHSGVEVGGEEFSFASGAGIFSSTPKEASGISLLVYSGGLIVLLSIALFYVQQFTFIYMC
jgi:hypothetical protein